MVYFASALAAIIPMAAYLIFIWKFDRYDREPFGLVLRNFLWGSLGATILSFIFSAVLNSIASFFITNKFFLDHLGAIVTAPVIEELMKGIFLFITMNNRKFDNLTDGIVYGGAIGLGFGMTENFLYFVTYGSTLNEWIFLVVTRSLFSGVMHCVSTATLGAFLGYAKYMKGLTKLFLILTGLSLAITIHFIWNVNVSFESTAFTGLLVMLSLISIFIIIFAFSVFREKKMIYNELLDEVSQGVIPAEHLYILNSSRRNSKGWIDESKRKRYISAATTLAFRKMQLKKSSGSNIYFCEQDIQNNRLFIKELLLNKAVE